MESNIDLWSHNPKVEGSNPSPATNFLSDFSDKFPFSLPFIITSLSTCHIPCHNKSNIIFLSFFVVDAYVLSSKHMTFC